jgi:DnaK suppressor protein
MPRKDRSSQKTKRNPLTDQDLIQIRALLQKRREEIFRRVRRLQTDLREFAEPQVEFEEEAQEAELSEPVERLSEQEQEEVRELDAALDKVDREEYGRCETCRRPIARKRLFALPWTRHCAAHARGREAGKKGAPQEGAGLKIFPAEYQGYTPAELREAIVEEIQDDSRVDSRELAIQVQNGRIFLRGYLPNGEQHQILLQILTDVMGLQNIDDRVSLDHTLWEREKNERPTAGREFTGNIVDSVKEGTPYSPPDRPIPEENE